MSQLRINVRKGQTWKKRRGQYPFYAMVTGKKGGKVKTVCSDGNTHTFLPFILVQKFDLVEE
jgi:hypothetical protein